MLVGLVSLFAVGCGDNNSPDGVGFVATGTTNAVPNTGAATFNFATPQIGNVPTGTVQLVFSFYDTSNTLIFQTPRTFATTITITNIPVTATRVEIVANNAQGFPLRQLNQAVNLQAGVTTVIDLSTATVINITFDSITCTPSPVLVTNQGTQQLLVQAQFSNGLNATVDITTTTLTGQNNAIATVSNAGLVTGVAAGNYNLTISFTVSGTTRQVVVPIRVQTFVLQPNPVNVILNSTSTRPISAIFTTFAGVVQNVTPNTTFAITPAVAGLTIVTNDGSITAVAPATVGTNGTVTGSWNDGNTTFTNTTTVSVVAAPG